MSSLGIILLATSSRAMASGAQRADQGHGDGGGYVCLERVDTHTDGDYSWTAR